jgi:predicted RNA-binding Zn-ribbon protein involved in translation (DUF1610 family)
MEAETAEAPKKAKTFDSAYSFSFAIAVGLILFIAGLVIALTMGEGTSLGLIFGIPLLIAGLVVPLFMMRDLFKGSAISSACPACATPIKTSEATLHLTCPTCNRVIRVRDGQFYLVDEVSVE